MLVEVKVKVARDIDNKVRKRSEVYILENCQLFAEAEYKVTAELTEEVNSHLVEDFEIQSIKVSQLKEVYTQYTGDSTFIATLKDIFLETDGTEKVTKYKVLLWAKDLTEATKRTADFAKQGYNLAIESLKEVDYIYLNEENNASEQQETKPSET